MEMCLQKFDLRSIDVCGFLYEPLWLGVYMCVVCVYVYDVCVCVRVRAGVYDMQYEG